MTNKAIGLRYIIGILNSEREEAAFLNNEAIPALSCLTTNMLIPPQMPGEKFPLKTEARTPSAYTQSSTLSISNGLELVACHKQSAWADRNSKQIPLQKGSLLKRKHRKSNLPLSRHS